MAYFVRAPLSMFALLRTISEIIGSAPTAAHNVFATPTASRSRFEVGLPPPRVDHVDRLRTEQRFEAADQREQDHVLDAGRGGEPAKFGTKNAFDGSSITSGMLTSDLGRISASPRRSRPRTGCAGGQHHPSCGRHRFQERARAAFRNGKANRIARLIAPMTAISGLRFGSAAGMAAMASIGAAGRCADPEHREELLRHDGDADRREHPVDRRQREKLAELPGLEQPEQNLNDPRGDPDAQRQRVPGDHLRFDRGVVPDHVAAQPESRPLRRSRSARRPGP